MGTSRRNVMAIALTEILSRTYTKEFLDQLRAEIKIDYKTATTINELVTSKIEQVDRHHISKRVYFGLLISNYFLEHESALVSSFSTNGTDQESKGHIQFEIAEADKNKISAYCEANSIGISSLYVNYLLYEDVEIFPYNIENKVDINILLNSHAKNVLKNRSYESNCSYKFFLQMVTRQIIRHIDS